MQHEEAANFRHFEVMTMRMSDSYQMEDDGSFESVIYCHYTSA